MTSQVMALLESPGLPADNLLTRREVLPDG